MAGKIAKRSAVERRLAEVRRELRRLTNLMIATDSDVSAELSARYKERGVERDRLQTELAALPEEIPAAVTLHPAVLAR